MPVLWADWIGCKAWSGRAKQQRCCCQACCGAYEREVNEQIVELAITTRVSAILHERYISAFMLSYAY